MTTFYIEQFGCRATQADGAAIERQLRDQGCLAAADTLSADFVGLNTCTVPAAADAQARDAIRKIHAANPSTRIIVTGCYAQRAPEEIAALRGVTHVVGNSHKPQIPSLLQSISNAPLIPRWKIALRIIMPRRFSAVTSLLSPTSWSRPCSAGKGITPGPR